MTKIEGVPDGYELVRFGSPSNGDSYLSLKGIVKVAVMDFVGDCRPIVRKIEPPKPIEPPKGYRLLNKNEMVHNWDMYLSDSGWVELLGGKEEYAQTYGFTYARKIEPKVRPMTRAEFLAAWKQRGFCPLIDHEDDIDIVLGVIDEPTEFDPEIVNTEKHGWLSLDVLSGFKFASDETYLTVEE